MVAEGKKTMRRLMTRDDVITKQAMNVFNLQCLTHRPLPKY